MHTCSDWERRSGDSLDVTLARLHHRQPLYKPWEMLAKHRWCCSDEPVVLRSNQWPDHVRCCRTRSRSLMVWPAAICQCLPMPHYQRVSCISVDVILNLICICNPVDVILNHICICNAYYVKQTSVYYVSSLRNLRVRIR